MPGRDPPILMCSHIPIKRESFTCVEVPVLMGSLEVQEHPQVALPQENPLVQEPPLQHSIII
jgi:hypothetical protein